MDDAAEIFVNKVETEFMAKRQYEMDGQIRADWLAAIKKVFTEYECPDCKYSIVKGHQV